MAGAAIPDVYAPPMPATTLGNMVKTFLQKILDITDPDFAAPLPDAGALLAAAGVPAHAIREVLGSRTYTGADG